MNASPKTMTFKALSALLTYPTEELRAAIPEIRSIMAGETVVARATLDTLAPLLADLGTLDLYDLQERYVDLFDRTRRLSLHLFEHIHGESRDRGQAMVDLAAHYNRAGLDPTANELPDYLPLFLEFLSTRPIEEARGLISETAHILSLLEERLAKRGSAYAAVLSCILSNAGESARLPDTADAADQPDDLTALDAAWEETAVSFGPGDASPDGCSVDRLRTQIRAGRRDARHMTA